MPLQPHLHEISKCLFFSNTLYTMNNIHAKFEALNHGNKKVAMIMMC